ncbi:MAG: serine protease AprX [Aureispira sp.]|jgi:serine protease AprX
MRKFLFLVFVFQMTNSQSIADRFKIRSTYNPNSISKLTSEFNNEFISQKNLISKYKDSRLVKESEQKSLQRIYDGVPIYFTTENTESGITIRANSLYEGGELGLNLSGKGIVAGVWDGGKVRSTHQEFANGRVVLGDNFNSFSSHGSHVTGTIIGGGIDAKSKGIAFGGTARTFYWDLDLSEMTTFGAEGYLVSNHSYGYNITDLANWRFGAYDQTSTDYDKISEVFPYYQIVVAAGNSRNLVHPQIIAKSGYDLLSGSALSKNCLVVAAVSAIENYDNASNVRIASFSNYGPTDDGRIKPDIAAQGVGVFSASSISDVSYETLNGTSMAAPAITGLVLLLQEHFKNLNGYFMKAASVRGLICHTASEAGFTTGPDYEYGWGLANGKEAAKLISNNGIKSIIKEENLINDGVYTRTFSINTTQPLSVSIAWTDPAGVKTASGVEDSRAPILINNLDLKLIKDGVVFYPWKLNPDIINQAATNNSENEVDNIEKVFIENAEPGIYTIQVTHKGLLLNGSQEFSLIADGQTSTTLSSSEFVLNDGFRIYPNPAQEFLFFDIPLACVPQSIGVFDLTGKMISSFNYEQKNNIDISGLMSGVYIVKFTCEDKTVNLKFVKN